MAQSSSLMTEKIKRTEDALLRVVPGQTFRIPKAMQMFGGFTSAEICDRKLEHRIRNQIKKARNEEVDRELQTLMADMSIEVYDDNMSDISPVSIDVGYVDTSQSTSFSFTRSYNTIDSSDKTLKKAYRTPHQVETDAINKAIIQRRKDIVMAEATGIVFAQTQAKASTNLERKNLKLKAARRIVEEMKEKHGVEIHERLVRSYVTGGIVGEAMLKMVPVVKYPAVHFKP
jgi:hypothetical protein